MPKFAIPKWLVISFVMFVVSLGLILVAMAMSEGGVIYDQLSNQGQQIDKDQDPQPKLTDFLLAAVTIDDTVTLLDQELQEIPIQLQHDNWSHPLWSPDAEVLVISSDPQKTTTYNINLYYTSTKSWDQITGFVDEGLGVSGYDWLAETKLMFTQGQAPDNWMHIYDLVSGEVRKIYRVDDGMQLRWVDIKHSRLMLSKNTGSEVFQDRTYQLMSVEGELIYEFKGELIGEGHRILDVIPGRSQGEFLIVTNSGISRDYFLFNINERVYNPIALNPELDIPDISVVDEVVPTEESIPEGNTLDEQDPITEITPEPEAPVEVVVPTYAPRLVCPSGSKLYFAYDIDTIPGTIIFLHINPETAAINEIASYEGLGRRVLLDELTVCNGGDTIFKLDEVRTPGQNASWLRLTNDKLVEIDYLGGYVEVGFTPEV